MRFLLTFCLFFSVLSQASGQGGLDTLGLTGTMADTAVARRMYYDAYLANQYGKQGEAIEKLDSALLIYYNALGKNTTQYANTLNLKGTVYLNSGFIDSAINIFQQTIKIREFVLGTNHLDVARAYHNLAISYSRKKSFENAVIHFIHSQNIRIEQLPKNDPEMIWSFHDLGITYLQMGKYQESEINMLKAKEIMEAGDVVNQASLAFLYSNLGHLYANTGKDQDAIYCYKKAYDINISLFGPNDPRLAWNLDYLGQSNYFMGDYNKMKEYYEKSLEIRKKVFPSNDPVLGMSYENIGVAYQFLNDFDKSLEYMLKGLKLRLDNFDGDSLSLAGFFNNIGNVYSMKNDGTSAVFFFNRALEIEIKILGEYHRDVANLFGSMGAASLANRNFEQAIQYYKKSLSIYELSIGKESIEYASDLSNLGVAFNSLQSYDSALFCYKLAIEIATKVKGRKHPLVGDFLVNIGNTYLINNSLDTAEAMYHAALEAFEFTDINHISEGASIIKMIELFNAIGKVNYLRFNDNLDANFLRKATEFYQYGLSAISYQHNFSISEQAKFSLQESTYPVLEGLYQSKLLQYHLEGNNSLISDLYFYRERFAANLLQFQIQELNALAFAGIPDSLLQQEHNLRIDITWREKQRQGLLDKGLTETDTNVLRISGIIFDLKQQYETLKKRFETEYPEYYRLKYDLSTVSLAYVQDTLLQKDQALLEYFTGDSSLFLFVVRPDTFLVQEVKRDFPLEAWIDSLRFGLYGYYAADKSLRTDSLRIAALNSYIRHAQLLQDKLIAPVAAWLPEKVILVPDGPLGYIPFDALLKGAPEDPNNFKSYPYLLQQHQFSYTYSATLLREMRDKKHRQEPEKDFAAFAPFYNGDTTLLAGMYAYDELMRKDLQPLAFSGPEVAAAAKLMKGETIAGSAATEERFTSTAGNYRILHLATHGRADNRVGDYAFLAFNEIKDSIENELLYVKDLYNLQLNADLVVLSACETGIGKLQRGEGIISLARAFAYAGAKSIVTSLWSVNDKSTSELMRFFYRELRRGKDKDEALRLARQRLLRESNVRNAHPFFWAAFVPLGDMRGVR